MRSTAVLLALALSLSACKDGLVEPERFGSIEGTVFNVETFESVNRATVATSPATSSVQIGDDGTFTIDEVLVGTYTISASRDGFDPNTVTVQVREGQTTRADIPLRVEEPDDDGSSDVIFGAEVLRFTNEPFTSDSSFVTVEYRALNNGETAIGTYEVYFRIDTDRGSFYQEVNGTNLGPGQRDLGMFRRQLLGGTAQVVVVEGTDATEAASDGSGLLPPTAR